MTYRELLEQLQKLSPEQLGQDVTVYDFDGAEFYPASFLPSVHTDVLDEEHPVIKF